MRRQHDGGDLDAPRGFALRFMRHIKGQDAYWVSCQAVIDAHGDDMAPYDRETTPVGHLLWFTDSGAHRWGNVALYLGNGWALHQHEDGEPGVRKVTGLPGELVGTTERIPD